MDSRPCRGWAGDHGGNLCFARRGRPARAGATLFKVARRTGSLNPALVTRVARDVVKVEEAGGLAELAGNVGRVESKAGTGAALESLKAAETPEDVSRFARLATVKGGKTRAIVKLLGRGAIILAASTLTLANWLLWAAFLLLGFASLCKAAAERMTLAAFAGAKRIAYKPREPIAAVAACSADCNNEVPS